MKDIKIVVVGAGIVGNNFANELSNAKIQFDFHDPYKKLFAKEEMYDYAVICVPTDSKNNGECNTAIVEEVCKEWRTKSEKILIKSTVPPGTTRKIQRRIGGYVAFSPEYYGATLHANTPRNFVILGILWGSDIEPMMDLFKRMYTGYTRMHVVSSECAELVKYAENTWLGMQVTFFSQMYAITKALNVNDSIFRETLLLDERISRSHSIAYGPNPHYDSHCLNKDIPALSLFCKYNEIPNHFIQSIIDSNTLFKEGK